MTELTNLDYDQLRPTRDYLQDSAKVMGKLQQLFLPPEPHDWHYGLEVGPRGLQTQECLVAGQPLRAVLDSAAGEFQLGDSIWPLTDYSGPELLNNVKVWLHSHGVEKAPATPEFSSQPAVFDAVQAAAYGQALQWYARQLAIIKAKLSSGLVSPLLVYPHHFDLAFSWLVGNDERQLTFGWSTGDQTIAEPYVYLTTYPDPTSLSQLKLPKPGRWQSQGFTGAVLLHQDLVAAADPAKLLSDFGEVLLAAASLPG